MINGFGTGLAQAAKDHVFGPLRAPFANPALERSKLCLVAIDFRDHRGESSVPDLVAAIDEYVAHHNTKPKPFIWTKSATDILQKVIRANARLSSKKNATLH